MYHGHYNLLSAGRIKLYAHGLLCVLQLFHCRKKVVQIPYVIFCDGEYLPVLCRLKYDTTCKNIYFIRLRSLGTGRSLCEGSGSFMSVKYFHFHHKTLVQ